MIQYKTFDEREAVPENQTLPGMVKMYFNGTINSEFIIRHLETIFDSLNEESKIAIEQALIQSAVTYYDANDEKQPIAVSSAVRNIIQLI